MSKLHIQLYCPYVKLYGHSYSRCFDQIFIFKVLMDVYFAEDIKLIRITLSPVNIRNESHLEEIREM